MSEVRRCDGRCHSAEHEKCVCWCGGLFHGKKGAGNRQRMVEIIAEKFPDAVRGDDGTYYMTDGPAQMQLF